MTLRALCPAKVNLRLRILGRRPDGFHELDTVFQAIDLEDELTAEPASALTLEVDDPAVPAGPENLVWKAAELLGGGGARLRLRKRIPAGGGLGGGSSDAAGALLLLDRLWDRRTPRAELARMAASLGSDVAFFLAGGRARGTGRGERIAPLPFADPGPLLLGLAPFPVPTAEAYRRYAAQVLNSLTPVGPDVSVPLPTVPNPTGDKDLEVGANDLEEVVFAGWPALRDFRDALLHAGARAALLSGSGSTVFGVFAQFPEAEEAAAWLERTFPGWRTLPARATARGARLAEDSEPPLI